MDGMAQVKSINVGGRQINLEPGPMPRNLEVQLPNNMSVKAPMEVWIGAIMTVLTPEQKKAMIEMVGKMTL